MAATFDQNARHTLAYIDHLKDLYVYWFDTITGIYVSTYLDSNVDSVRLDLDDRRPNYLAFSNIYIAYTKSNVLYFRIQEDKYLVPYPLVEGVQGRVLKVGVSVGNRLQVLFEQTPFPVYEDPWPYGAI